MIADRKIDSRTGLKLALIGLLTVWSAFATALGQGGSSAPPHTLKLSLFEESLPPRPPLPPP